MAEAPAPVPLPADHVALSEPSKTSHNIFLQAATKEWMFKATLGDSYPNTVSKTWRDSNTSQGVVELVEGEFKGLKEMIGRAKRRGSMTEREYLTLATVLYPGDDVISQDKIGLQDMLKKDYVSKENKVKLNGYLDRVIPPESNENAFISFAGEQFQVLKDLKPNEKKELMLQLVVQDVIQAMDQYGVTTREDLVRILDEMVSHRGGPQGYDFQRFADMQTAESQKMSAAAIAKTEAALTKIEVARAAAETPPKPDSGAAVTQQMADKIRKEAAQREQLNKIIFLTSLGVDTASLKPEEIASLQSLSSDDFVFEALRLVQTQAQAKLAAQQDEHEPVYPLVKVIQELEAKWAKDDAEFKVKIDALKAEDEKSKQKLEAQREEIRKMSQAELKVKLARLEQELQEEWQKLQDNL